MVAAAGKARGEPVGTIFELADRLVHPFGRLGMDPRPPVEHAVDRGKADAGGARHVVKRRPSQ